MNFLRAAIAVAVLLASAIVTADKPKGYDLGACSPEGFYAVHIILDKDQQTLTLDLISEKEGEVEKADKPVVYKLEMEKDSKQVYLFEAGGHKYEIGLDLKENEGIFVVDGAPAAMLFVTQDDDGAKLVENASKSFKACVDLVTKSLPSDKA